MRLLLPGLLATFTSLCRLTFAQTEPDELLSVPHVLRTPSVSDFAIAPDGKRVALELTVLGKETIWLIEGDGTAGRPLSTGTGAGERNPDWAPDGTGLAFVSNRAGSWQLYVSDGTGANAQTLSEHSGEDRNPRWSPDGKLIAYLSRKENRGTGWDLWVTSGTAEGPAKQLTEIPLDEEDFRWSPDGKRIAISTGGGDHQPRRLGIVDVETGQFRDLLPESWTGDSFAPRWVGDGERILFVSDEPGRKSLFTVSAKGGTPEALVTSEYELSEPAISPDGAHVGYIENQEGDARLRIRDLERGNDRILTLRNGVHSNPTWRPDGKALLSLFEAWNYSADVWAYPLEGGRERVSDSLPPELDVRKMVRPELVRFSTFDGRELTGYLYLPDSSREQPVSLLVRPHGGPTSQWQNGWHPFTQLLVQKGYAVFAPNVRGSSGFGVEFANLNDRAWGQGDLDDLVAGTRHVLSRPEVRDDRVGIWGVSYGGFLALAAIGRYPDLFSCAIEALGMPDLERLYRQTTDAGRHYLDRELGPLRGNLALYRELSPIRNVDRIRTPLLSFHGEVYPLVPYSVKEPFFEALRRRPAYPLLEFIFKGEEARATYCHDLHPEAAWAYVDKILEFLDVYL